jgi:hypothetical protein
MKYPIKKSMVLCLWGCLHAASLPAQPVNMPALGTVDFYGLSTVTEAQVRSVLPLQEGFDFTTELPEPDIVGRRMADALGVDRVELTLVCCTKSGLSQLYVGIQSDAHAGVPYFVAPTDEVSLPADIVANFEQFLDRMMASVLSGDASEDRTQGHALAEAAPVRQVQEAFLEQAERNVDLLIAVLSRSSNARHRAIAAHVLGYAPDKARIAPPLAAAVLDPDDGVRNYATRSLAVIAEYANAHPERGIRFPSDPFIEMLNSIVWSDRNKSLAVLAQLTRSASPELLEALAAQASASLQEMCRWHHPGHADAACLILERIDAGGAL